MILALLRVEFWLLLLLGMILFVVLYAMYENYMENINNQNNDNKFDIAPQAMRDEELLKNIESPNCPELFKQQCIEEYEKRKLIYKHLDN